MSFSTNKLLTGKNIYKLIDSYQIFKAYCTGFTDLDKSFNSELRKDPIPSCRISYMYGDLLYTDFGGKKFRAIPYVMEKYALSYAQALSKINIDFNLNLVDSFDSSNIKKEPISISSKLDIITPKSPTIIDVKYRPFYAGDIGYWESFGWTLTMLQRASIRAIDAFWITKESKGIIKQLYPVSEERVYSFDYYRNEGVYRRKLYFPHRYKEQRFISNTDTTVIQNWDVLQKKGDILYITSSKKDTGPFWRLNGWECNAIAPNSEVSFIPEEILYRKLKPRFKRIILWYDNDPTGIKNALILAKKHNLEAVWNPIGAPKDPSDYWAKHGGREFNYLKSKLI